MTVQFHFISYIISHTIYISVFPFLSYSLAFSGASRRSQSTMRSGSSRYGRLLGFHSDVLFFTSSLWTELFRPDCFCCVRLSSWESERIEVASGKVGHRNRKSHKPRRHCAVFIFASFFYFFYCLSFGFWSASQPANWPVRRLVEVYDHPQNKCRLSRRLEASSGTPTGSGCPRTLLHLWSALTDRITFGSGSGTWETQWAVN